MAVAAEPAAVLHALPRAFPQLCVLEEAGLIVHTCGRPPQRYPVASLTAGSLWEHDATWWSLAGHVVTALSGLNRHYTLGSGTAEFGACATVHRPSSRRWARVSSGWSDTPGLALCAAACSALLGEGP